MCLLYGSRVSLWAYGMIFSDFNHFWPCAEITLPLDKYKFQSVQDLNYKGRSLMKNQKTTHQAQVKDGDPKKNYMLSDLDWKVQISYI